MYVLTRSGISSRSGAARRGAARRGSAARRSAARRAFTKILFHVNEPKGTNTYLGRIQEGYNTNEYGKSFTHPQSFMLANGIKKFPK